MKSMVKNNIFFSINFSILIVAFLLTQCEYHQNKEISIIRKDSNKYFFNHPGEKRVYYYISQDSLTHNVYKLVFDTIINNITYKYIVDYNENSDSITPYSISKLKIIDSGFKLIGYTFLSNDSSGIRHLVKGEILSSTTNTLDSSLNNKLITSMKVEISNNGLNKYLYKNFQKKIEHLKNFRFDNKIYESIKVVDSTSLIFPDSNIYISFFTEKIYSKGIGITKLVEILPTKTTTLILEKIISYNTFKNMANLSKYTFY